MRIGIDRFIPNFSKIGPSFADGLLDNLLGDDVSDDLVAQKLFDMVLEFANIPMWNLDNELIDEYVGKIYLYIIEHRTLSYIYKFM